MKTLDLKDVETDITFSLHPIILLFPVAKVENSKLGCPPRRSESISSGTRETGMAFSDERNVFTAAQGCRWSRAKAVESRQRR